MACSMLGPEFPQELDNKSEWAAPILWRSEFRIVLALYLRKNLVTLNQAQSIMNRALELTRGREYEVSPFEALRLASETRIGATGNKSNL